MLTEFAFVNFISQTIKLSKTNQFQLLFVISMGLYHSSEYFEMGSENQHQNVFLLRFFDKMSTLWLESFLILITVIMIMLIITKTYILSMENYFLELMERLFYPVQLYVFGKVVRQKYNDQFNFQLIVRAIFFIALIFTTLILLFKNIKLSLRYAGHREKGLNRLSSTQFLLTLTKIVSSTVLNLSLPDNFIVYMIVSGIINILMNTNFALNVTYQHPNIEYIALLTQFYLWVPFLSQLFLFIYSSTHETFLFNVIAFFIYIYLALVKPKIFMTLLQRKYSYVIRSINNHQYLSNELKTQKLSRNLIIIINVIVSLVFQPSNHQKQLQWSDSFKSNILIFIKSKTFLKDSQNKMEDFQYHNQKNPKQPQSKQIYRTKQNTQKQRKISSISSKSQKTSQTLGFTNQKIYLLGAFRTQLANKKLEIQIDNYQNFNNVYELLWSFIYPYISTNDKEFKNLRFLVCYTFPDTKKNMKFRLFHSYYLTCFDNFGIFCQIQAFICYKYLKTLTGSQLNYQKLLEQNDIFNEKQQNCLEKENSYYHAKFNDVFKQNQIRTQIIKNFQSFLKNQESYLKIFRNFNENKEKIRKYFQIRRQIRLRTQQNLKDYQKLKNKKSHFSLMTNYMKDYFLYKNQYQAAEKFQKQLSKLMVVKKHYLRKNIESVKNKTTYKQRIVDSIKQNFVSKKQSENITCVVSGLKNLGLIKISSPKFKQLMEVDTTNFPNQTQTATINYLSHFQLPLWRQKHVEEMKKIQFYEKPVHHEKKKYFLISHKGSNLIEVKFKMYFFVMYETDFLLVLDIKYEKCELLEIKDCHQKIVYSYKQGKDKQNIRHCNKNKNQLFVKQLLNQFTQDHQKYQQQTYQLYGSLYQLKTLKKQKLSTLIDKQFLANQKTAKNIQYTQKFHQENFILEEKKMLQTKFISFKKDFNIYRNLWNTLRTVVVCSILFFFFTFYFFAVEQKSNQQQALGFVKDKLLIQNKIISLDAYSSIQIGVLYEVVKGRIWFDKFEEKEQFLNIVFNSLVLLKSQLHEKFQLSQFDNKNQGQIGDYLYQTDWIPHQNISLMTHTLMRQSMFYQSLSVFLDPLILSRTQNKSKFNLSQSIQLQKDISFKQQDIITRNLYETLATKNYFFDTNGVIDQIIIIEKQLIASHSYTRTLFLIIISFGFTCFSSFTIFIVIKMKKSILLHYNGAILVSEPFKRKFESQVTKLRSYISQIKKCSQNDLSQKIRPQRISYYHQSRKLTYVRKYTGQGLKTSIWNKKGTQQKDESQLSVTKYLLESVLFPFLRYFVILGSVLTIYQLQTEKIKILQNYSNSLTLLNRLNNNFVVGYGISLYNKKFQSNQIIVDMLRQQFYKSAKQIREIDKIKTIYDLFPFNPQIAFSVLFQQSSQSLEKLSLNEDKFSLLTPKSFMQETNHLILIQKALYNHYESKRSFTEDLRLHSIDCYQKVNHLFWFIDRITQKSYQLIKQKIKFEYVIWCVGLMTFLVIEFIMGNQHFNETLTQFNEEYLNLASYQQLKKQPGFQKFVNLSTKNYFITLDSDSNYMNHV